VEQSARGGEHLSEKFQREKVNDNTPAGRDSVGGLGTTGTRGPVMGGFAALELQHGERKLRLRKPALR
jgi:hypothetical protein